MRIALFEDDEWLVDNLTRLLESMGHQIVFSCQTLSESEQMLVSNDEGRLANGHEIDLAIVDGDLKFGMLLQDGAKICRLLKNLQPRPLIIGNSGGGSVEGADKQAHKKLDTLLEFLKTAS